MKDIIVTLEDYTGKNGIVPQNTDGYAMLILAKTRLTRLTRQVRDVKLRNISIGELMEETLKAANTIRSSWEFIHYTFDIQNVSRGFTHQLVRTRHASFAQQSLRAVHVHNLEENVLIPPSIQGNPDMEVEYLSMLRCVGDYYNSLVLAGVPPEDARNILPIGTQTSIMMKIDLRNLTDMVRKRSSGRVQSEYRQVCDLMVERVEKVHPFAKWFLNQDYLDDRKAFEAILDSAFDLDEVIQPDDRAEVKTELLRIVDRMIENLSG